jgi:hypothetical protein
MLAYKSAGITLPRDQVKTHEVRAVPWSWNIFNSVLYGTMETLWTCVPCLCLKRDNCICSHLRHSLTSFPKGQLNI